MEDLPIIRNLKRRNLTEVLKKLKRKDVIETQLTIIGETIAPFYTRKPHIGKLSCNLSVEVDYLY
jgi:hypothetical protein